MGAFGAHGLKSVVTPEILSVFETGVRYQMYHAFALLLAALLFNHISHRFLLYAGWCFTAGIILFSGSLYLMALTGLRSIGIVTPFGGICFLAGWLMLILTVFKIKKEN